MHHPLKHWLTLLAVSWLLLAPMVGQGQTASFHTLAITGTGQPVTRARIVLELGANLDAGSSVSFGATSVPADGAEHAIDGGDRVRVSGAGTRFATININIRSILNDPVSDKCTLKADTSPSKSYEFTLNGFPAVTGYRLTGFSAPFKSTSACTCQTRRVKAIDWDTPPPGVNRGRVPMDIVLILDRSGSMDSPTPGDPNNVTKWLGLRTAVHEFVNLWKSEVASADAATSALALDRLAVIYFSTDPETVLFGGSPFISRGTGAATHPWDALTDNVDAHGPEGLTALGGGIQNGFTATTNLVNDVTFVVMTDGMQNRSPMVEDGQKAENLGDKVLALGGGNEDSLPRRCIPMLTVAVGNASSPWDELMDKIALQTAGKERLTSGLNMPSAFAMSLVDALKGSTLSMALDKKGSLEAATEEEPRLLASQSESTPVFLDSSVKNARVVLNWLGTQVEFEGPNMPLGLTILRPDGKAVQPSQVLGDSFSYMLQRFDLPSDGPPGQWTLVVSRQQGSMAIPYQLQVFTEETGLDMRFDFARQRHETGAPITLNAHLRFNGKPLTNLGQGLTVRLERPAAALGTLLHELQAPQVPLPDVRDKLPAYERKLLALSTDAAFLQRVGPQKAGEAVPMKQREDGRYAFMVDDTKVPGTYRFHLTLETKTPQGEILRRVETVETKVEVIPDGPSSDIRSERTGDGTYVIRVVPKDQFGNFKGPGYDDRFSVKIDGEGRLESVDDPDVKGDYQVKLVGLKDETPITLTIGTSVVAKGPVLNLKPVPRPRPDGTPPGGTCGTCGSAGGDVILLFALPILVLLSRRRARRL